MDLLLEVATAVGLAVMTVFTVLGSAIVLCLARDWWQERRDRRNMEKLVCTCVPGHQDLYCPKHGNPL